MKQRDSRRSDSGTITIMAIALLTTLIGMAALAVDLGFMYTRSRMLYAVADSAVAVGMKDLVAGSSSTQINTDIDDMAAKYSGYTFTRSSTATTVTVTVTATYPLFFGKMVGLSSKALHVTAIGTKNTLPPPILALGNTCGTGVTINGQGALIIHGDLESNGTTNFGTGAPGPIVQGNVVAQCGTPVAGPGMSATGTFSNGGPFTDPFNPYTLPACTQGGTASNLLTTTGLGGFFDTSTIPATFPAGVYCSNSTLQLIDPGNGFIANGVTLISTGGIIQIMVNKASTITPNPASPNGIIAFTTANTGTFPGDIAITGPASTTLDMLGSFYAPAGTVNIQQNGPYKMGSIIASNVWIGDNGAWDIGFPTAYSSSAWQMSQ